MKTVIIRIVEFILAFAVVFGVLLWLIAITGSITQADEEKIVVPKSMLTTEQIKQVEAKTPGRWVGLGKEVGEAVNSSLQSINTETNNFSHTRVGKLTMALVVWKLLGDTIVHIAFGLLLLAIFVPAFLWSYYKNCTTHRIKTGKDTYTIWEYKTGNSELTPRIAHTCVLAGFLVVFLFTVFTY